MKNLRIGRFTAFSGLQGSGMTLSVVALLKQMSEGENCPNIITNAYLKEIPHEKFKLENLFNYKDSIIFIDIAEFIIIRDRNGVLDNIIGFLSELEENNNTCIITTQSLHFIEPIAVDFIDTIVTPNYKRDRDCVNLRIIKRSAEGKTSHPAYLRINNASRYFKSYDTFKMPGHKKFRFLDYPLG